MEKSLTFAQCACRITRLNMSNMELIASRFARNALISTLKEAPTRSIQIDGTMYLYIGADVNGQADVKIKKALAAGKTVIENGVSQWMDDRDVCDWAKHGSDVYTWHKDGSRVLCQRFRVTKQADGPVTEKFVRNLYLSPNRE